jgi:hypothetical protein
MPETITKAEIKDLIKEEGIKPSDLFDNDALTSDPFVKGFVKDAEKAASSGEYAHRKRTDTKFDSDREDWEKKGKEKDEEIKKLKVKDAKRDAVDIFAKKIKERKLDKQQSQFIENKQTDFIPDDLGKLDKEVDTFMDDRVEEFKKTAKIFGVKTEKTEEEKEETGSPPGNEEEQDENSLIPD